MQAAANMATRDSDTSLWLHNKLGTSNDSWTGSSICSQLNSEVLRNIKDCFSDLQNQVKLKLLLSFFHIPRRNVEEWRVELEEIIEVASLDSDLWVSMLSETLKTFPSSGSLNTDLADLDEHRSIFGELINDLRKLLRRKNDPNMLPLECHFLNKAALNSVVGHLPAATQHFKLNEKRKPKSATLRSELHQKCLDTTNNLKKNTAPTVPIRSRGMPRKMTDTTPLKGIPSRLPLSGFRSPSLSSSPLTNRSSLNNRIRKDGGIKLLDINEQPLGYAQAKKRKRQQELEEQQKKAEEAKAAAAQPPAPAPPTTEASTTPEYAQGLAPAVSQPPAAPVVVTTTVTPVVTPTTTETKPAVPYTPTISTAAVPVPVVTTAVPAVTPANVVVTTQSVVTPVVEAIPVTVQTVRPPPSLSQLRIGTPNAPAQQANAGNVVNAAGARRGLSLTREQMLEAQEMFRTANKVTRPEKALILGFMAGSRDNPCPKLGNIVTVMLSENVEEVTQPDGSTLLMTVETHFQMNYTNGEWKRIKKNRKIVEEGANAVAPH